MSNPIQVPDLFATGIEDVPTEQEQLRRAVEDATFAAVLPFEAEKQFVNRDHVAIQRAIWGEREDDKHPVELPTTGA